jgi:alpha-L-fucosidase 2
MGALVWGGGRPLRISLDRTDLWDLRRVPEFHSPDYTFPRMSEWHRAGRAEDLVRMYEAVYSRPEAPTKIPAGRIELQFGDEAEWESAALDLAEAVATTRVGGAEVRVFLHALKPIGFLSVTGAATVSARLLAPDFGGKAGGGELAKLGYPPPGETSGDRWQAFTQQGIEGFRFAVYLAWRSSGSEWLAAWSVASGTESADPLRLAQERVEQALADGFDRSLVSHREWWRDYWHASSLSLPNKVLERQWYLEQYKFGAASRRGAPPITLQGPWTADDGGLPPWKGDYHHDLNTQLSYWPGYSANHLEESRSFTDWLWATRPYCLDWTRRFYGLPGMNVPGVADLHNNPIGGWRQYTHSSTTVAWLAQYFHWHWRYTLDRAFLRDRAYPYLRDASTFIEAHTETRDDRGQRTLALSASPEINDNRPEAWFSTFTNYDLALVRWLLGATAELADDLKLPEEAAHWREVLSQMPDFAVADDGRLLITEDTPLPYSHRHISHLMAIHPLSLINWEDGSAAQQTIGAALGELDRLGTSLWCGYSFPWYACLAARARDGRRAEHALEVFATAFTLRNSFHCNGDQSGQGYSQLTYRPFTLEGNFAAAAATQEMLLQSHGGLIRIFPAVPDEWRDVSFTTLRAEGAFLVSAKREGGETKRGEITASAGKDACATEGGGACRLVSPWSGKELVLKLECGERVVLTGDPAR